MEVAPTAIHPSTNRSLQHVNLPTLNLEAYSLEIPACELLQVKLMNAGVQTAIHYPVALPFLACYAHLRFTEKDFPVASNIQNKILSLPMYAELSEAQIKYIVEIIKK